MAARVFDCFTFFNEFDILDLRLQTLWDHVDHFVLVEGNRTFTGKPKAFEYLNNAARFERFKSKIIHVGVEDMPVDPSPWTAEFHQRNCISRGLRDAAPDDLVIVSDVDEIPKPEALKAAFPTAKGAITLFGLEQFHFKLNLCVTRVKNSRGAAMIERRHLRSPQVLRNVRTWKSQSVPSSIERAMWTCDVLRTHRALLNRVVVLNGAWHFSFMMDAGGIRHKLASYSHVELNTAERTSDVSLNGRLQSMTSMFGEPMRVVPTTDLPLPVSGNKTAWEHLLYDPQSTAGLARSPEIHAVA